MTDTIPTDPRTSASRRTRTHAIAGGILVWPTDHNGDLDYWKILGCRRAGIGGIIHVRDRHGWVDAYEVVEIEPGNTTRADIYIARYLGGYDDADPDGGWVPAPDPTAEREALAAASVKYVD